jgi:hypothetical protein
MYIISKKKDYYDGVAGTTGIDKTIVYDRQIIEIDEKDYPQIFKRGNSWTNKKSTPFCNLNNTSIKRELRIAGVYAHIAPFVIGFCGKLYVGWKLYSEDTSRRSPYTDKELITTITYDNENIKNLVEQHYWWGGNFEDNLNYVLTYDPIEFFREFNVPVFVYDSDYGRMDIPRSWNNNPKFFINPLLKEYQFYKIFDAVQAFQEISMFLSGVLGNKEKEIVQVADKYKIAGHGFDKWSFRKEPEDKKQ